MTDLADRIRDLVANESGLEHAALGFTDDLTVDHGIDDLDLMKIAMRLEEVFGVEVSDDALQQERTVAQCVDLVCEGAGGRRASQC